MAVFKQNLTSDLIYRTIIDLPLNKGSRFLDLGCGDGNIGIRVARFFGFDGFAGSDVSSEAVNIAAQSASEFGFLHDFRVGNGFEPWAGELFDIISCDVAAISQRIAEVSDWYDGVSCLTGDTGLDLVSPIISEAKSHLVPDGLFVIPKISLANSAALERELEKHFAEVIEANVKRWPVPLEVTNGLRSAGMPLKTNNWEIDEQFGLFLATTSVLVCRGG